jgi:hypothetical protein
MVEDNTNTGHTAARAMIDTFASVGATRFDITWTTYAGDKEWFRRGANFLQIQRALPAMLDAAPAKQRNIIVRPRGPDVTFIQLDDLKNDQLSRVAPAVFLALETSPGNFQAWVAMQSAEDKDFARRLKKGVGGADKTASGATRVAGSINFKEKYAPDFPRVTIHAMQPKRMTTTDELDRLGLVASPASVEQPPRLSPARTRPGPGIRKWPNYERCLENAPPSQSRPGQTRESIADFTWCLIAADWGWPVDEIVRQLMEESAKARENGQTYAQQTATRAAEAAQRNAAEAAERRNQTTGTKRAAD